MTPYSDGFESGLTDAQSGTKHQAMNPFSVDTAGDAHARWLDGYSAGWTAGQPVDLAPAYPKGRW